MKKIYTIMQSGNDNAVVRHTSCFRDVLEEMNAKRMGAVCVVDDNDKLIGLVTDGDVRRLLLKTQDPLPELFLKNVTKIMVTDPKVISPDADLSQCLQMLEKYNFWVVPVTDNEGVLTGLVHMHSLLKALSK